MHQRGFTLVELLVVVMIMAGLLSIAVMAGGDADAKGRDTATRASLQAIREAIVGGTSNDVLDRPSFRRDLAAFVPPGFVVAPGLPRNSLAPIAEQTWSLSDLLDGRALPPFDAVTGRGWRGPYVVAPRAVFGTNRDADPRWTAYGYATDWSVADGWDQPIVLQVPQLDADPLPNQDELTYARLVSGGADGVIDTPYTGALAAYPTMSSCGDDLVLYLRVADLRP